MPTHADAIAIFDRRRLAWLAEDEAGYLACWTEDMRFASPVHDPPIVGLAAYAALVRRSAAAVRPIAFDVRHLAVDGPFVLAEWTIRVADRASGREIAWDGMSRARYDGERIADWREYWNPTDLRAIREADESTSVRGRTDESPVG